MSKKSKKQEVKTNLSFKEKFKNLLTAKSVGSLILRIVILLIIPYAYLMLCGVVFEKWLKIYTSFASNFTFFTLIALFIVALFLIGCCIKWYSDSKKGKKK